MKINWNGEDTEKFCGVRYVEWKKEKEREREFEKDTVEYKNG